MVRFPLFTMGYLAYDFYAVVFYMESKGAKLNEAIFHHVVGITGLCSALVLGYSGPAVGNITMLTEMSTFFLNYREMYSIQEIRTELMPQVCQVIFFILFFFIRMFGFPFATYRLMTLGYYIWDRVGTFRKICWALTTFLYFIMYLLNLYWFNLILQGMGKMLGIIKVKPKKKKVEEKD